MWMNVACLVGRAASDPKRKTTKGGTEYVTLRVAVPRNKHHTDFFTVELWGNVALKHVTAGRMLSLRCEMRQEAWTKDGVRIERVGFNVRKLGLLTHEGKTDSLDVDDEGMPEAA